MGIIDWIVKIYIVVFWAVIIIGNSIRGVMWLKCHKVKRCLNKKCRFRQYCNKYYGDSTDEALENIIRLLGK